MTGEYDAAVRAILGEPDGLKRASLVVQLVDQFGADTETMLLGLLESDEYYAVRMNSATLLQRLGCVSALPALVAHLRADVNGQVRECAASALGRLGDESALKALEHALMADDDPDVRERAAEALSRFDSPSARETLRRSVFEEKAKGASWYLRRALANGDPH